MGFPYDFPIDLTAYSSVITNLYRQRLSERLADEDYLARPTHLAIGTGVATEDPKKLTALVNEIHRTELTERRLSGAVGEVAEFWAIITSNAANDTWKEIGLLNARGDLLIRDEDSGGLYTKSSGEVKIVRVQLRIA